MRKIDLDDLKIVFTDDFSLISDVGKRIVITDINVFELGLHKDLNYDEVIVIEPGEESKRIEVVAMIVEELLKLNVNRSDTLIALGGGVVGDICGFVASIYKRGINYIQIPTTLLAMADSSIGGKTGINYNKVKNCIGTFYDPNLVIINTEFLKTLNSRQLSNGFYEIIKVGAIKDSTIIDDLEKDFDLESILYKAINAKKYFVCEDKLEKNLRKSLNFGHTLGHAIESYYGLNEVYHGEAVALGMLPMFDNEKDRIRIHNLYKKFGLTEVSYEFDKIWKYILNDKKRSNENSIDIVRVKKLGSSYIQTFLLDDLYIKLKGA